MRKYFTYIGVITLVAGVTLSCSRKKDKFLNRGFHAMATKYNVLYNGNLAFEQGKKDLIQTFFDDYWEILPVERMEVSEDFILPGSAKNANFGRAEDKAVKAIKTHGMNIRGKEKNPQADEAYLLLGKARYFDQRFVPALEAFNYILYKYPSSDRINHAKIWREKVNIRLENTTLAIKHLKRLIETEKLSKQDLSDGHAMLAQAYINNKHLDSALTHIKIAVENTRDSEVRGRLGFIKGQVYNRLGYKDSANMAFDEIIALKRRTLWIYRINAQIEKARNFNFEKGDKVTFLEYLKELEETRENKPYLDKVYNQLAVYYQNTKSDSLAKVFYNKSLKKSTQDRYLQSLNYRALGAYKFDAAQYKEAGMYYDSTLMKLKPKTKEHRLFKKKRDNLQDVIDYEELAKRNDSIIKVLSYTDDERITYYEKYIKKLKEADSIRLAKEKELNASNTNPNITITSQGPKTNYKTFYFYNATATAYGKVEFRKIWGDRMLEDDWRRSNKGIRIDDTDEEEEEEVEVVVEEKDIHKPEYYIAKLPKGQKAQDSIVGKRNFAYYQLGLIYMQKFKENKLAAKRLRKLISFEPSARLMLPAKYYLYKIYEADNDSRKETIKADIIANYPDSRYAEILRNPSATLNFAAGSPESLYNGIYKRFENQEYEAVLDELNKYIPQFEGEPMKPKYELLKAVVLGKINGVEAYRENVSHVALNYPSTDEGKKAQALLQTSIPEVGKLKLQNNNVGKSFKLVYILDSKDKELLEALKERVAAAKTDTYKEHLKVSRDYYNREKAFVVVHGFITPETAKNFHLFLQENKKKYKPSSEYVVMSTENYKVVQLHKNLKELLQNP